MFERIGTESERAAVLVAMVMAVVVAAAGCSNDATAARTAVSAAERGAYLVSVAGCDDCHTPLKLGAKGPEPDLTRRLSGHPEDFRLASPGALPAGWVWAGAATNTAFAGPWGVSFASNLTPDLETGLGIYSEDSFVAALRTGKHMGAGRPILPPMPWPAYRNMTDDDLKAVWAYLQTLTPVRNQVPEVVPPAG